MSETKVTKKTKAKKGSLLRTIVMAVLCVALLSGATYAWFTLSNTAKISNLSMTVGGAGGLLISYKSDGDFGSELKLGDASDKKVIPASIGEWNSKTALFKPDTYTTEITGMTEVATAEKLKYTFSSSSTGTWNNPSTAYCVEQDFYLKINAEGTYNIALNGTDFTNMTSSDMSNVAGSYIVEKDASGNFVQATTADLNAASILRIAFYVYNGDTPELKAIYEPNADANPTVNAGEYIASPSAFTPYSTNVIQQGVSGKFEGNTDGTYDATTSNALFQMTGGTQPTKVMMQVYFDGDDAQCANGVALEKIFGQIEFVSSAAN